MDKDRLNDFMLAEKNRLEHVARCDIENGRQIAKNAYQAGHISGTLETLRFVAESLSAAPGENASPLRIVGDRIRGELERVGDYTAEATLRACWTSAMNTFWQVEAQGPTPLDKLVDEYIEACPHAWWTSPSNDLYNQKVRAQSYLRLYYLRRYGGREDLIPMVEKLETKGMVYLWGKFEWWLADPDHPQRLADLRSVAGNG
jgi:hypothetical protein